jgi:hypothetical protein
MSGQAGGTPWVKLRPAELLSRDWGKWMSEHFKPAGYLCQITQAKARDIAWILADPRLTALTFAESALDPVVRALKDADEPDLLLDAIDLRQRISLRLAIANAERQSDASL